MRMPPQTILIALLAGAPALAMALEFEEAAHLLRRTGFAPTLEEVEALLPLSREEAVDQLLAAVQTAPQTSPPAWATVDLGAHYRQVQAENEQWRQLPDQQRNDKFNARRKDWRKKGEELKAWWLEEMATTPSPLTERVVAIWHNHFTTELAVVEDPVLIYEQHRLFREKGFDNFGRLAMAITFDPAMFRYLDSNSNVKGRPNENFAREVMELYTVGEGNYSEEDIKEAARAFTGYKIDPQTGKPTINENLHDAAQKRVLGHKGYFDGEKIILRLLQKEEDVALHMATKMWKEFIGPEPSDEKQLRAWQKDIWEIAKAFYRDRKLGHYFIKPLLRATLLHEAFWDPANRGVLIKSPYELVVGAYRQLGIKPNGRYMVKLCSDLGQDPFDPPNVKGWHGYTAWISTQSFMARQETTERLLGKRAGGGHWLAQLAGQGEAGFAKAQALLVPLPHPALEGGNDARLRDLITSSLYQLK